MQSARPRALVVDDEKHVRSLLCDVLAGWGVAADSALDGSDGLRLFERGDYDLILTDFRMPGVSGLELVRSVRKQNARVGIIMLTASFADLDGEGQRLGFALLHKPVDLAGLEAVVRKVLSQSGARPEAAQAGR